MPLTARRGEAGVGRGVDAGARPMKMLAGPARTATRATGSAAETNGSAEGASGSMRADRPLEGLVALRADPRRAIEENSIRCLICGQLFRQLTNAHLRGHNMGAVEYKRRFGYNRGRPLMCHVLQRLYADRAVKSGLAAGIRCRPILVEPGLRRLGGSRAIALEELLTRREARRRPPPPDKA
jgi:ROS/MUCR transcriptional regulator protein